MLSLNIISYSASTGEDNYFVEDDWWKFYDSPLKGNHIPDAKKVDGLMMSPANFIPPEELLW
jgi:hypothetical protein